MNATISQLLTDIGTGIGSFLPTFMKALLDGFVAIFFDTPAAGGASAGLSLVGVVALVFIIIGACYKFIPTILRWLRLGTAKLRGRRKRSR